MIVVTSVVTSIIESLEINYNKKVIRFHADLVNDKHDKITSHLMLSLHQQEHIVIIQKR